jgi:hypothetical protein
VKKKNEEVVNVGTEVLQFPASVMFAIVNLQEITVPGGGKVIVTVSIVPPTAESAQPISKGGSANMKRGSVAGIEPTPVPSDIMPPMAAHLAKVGKCLLVW